MAANRNTAEAMDNRKQPTAASTRAGCNAVPPWAHTADVRGVLLCRICWRLPVLGCDAKSRRGLEQSRDRTSQAFKDLALALRCDVLRVQSILSQSPDECHPSAFQALPQNRPRQFFFSIGVDISIMKNNLNHVPWPGCMADHSNIQASASQQTRHKASQRARLCTLYDWHSMRIFVSFLADRTSQQLLL